MRETSSPTKLLVDTGTVLRRELRPAWRDPFSVVFSMAQPLVFLALFGPLLARTSDLPGESLWQWFVPGILVMVALFGTTMTGSNLLYEMHTGSHERMTVTPLSRSSLLVGRALKEMVPLAVQAVLIVAVVVPFGFRPHPVGAVLGVLLLATLGVGLGALSYALALAVRNQEWAFWAVQQTAIFPLLLLSGMLLPLDHAPGWMRVASKADPLTYLVDAERALFAGDVLSAAAGQGAVAAVAVAVVGLYVGTQMMRKVTS